MELPIYQVDAFSHQVFGGNPAAVCLLEEWLPARTMQQIAAENNLSETAFIVKDGANYAIRWFTPLAEVDLCGHATLAAAHVLFDALNYARPQLLFQSKSGPLTVEKKGNKYIMDFPSDAPKRVEKIPEGLVEGLRQQLSEVFKGKDDFLVVLPDEASIRQLDPHFFKLKALPARGVIVTAKGNQVDFVSRCFYPAYGINEDPVTGSAHTTLAPYWANELQKKKLSARQLSQRKGEITCHYLGDRVQLEGQAVTYLSGTIKIGLLSK